MATGPLTLKDAEVLIARIKERYPKPRRAEQPGPFLPVPAPVGAYCVGGALVILHDRSWASRTLRYFPDENKLGDVLQDINTALSQSRAFEFASGIIEANDDGEFDKAYEVLLSALTYQPKEVTCRDQ